MNFLLDTNVLSEWTKPRPDPGVVAWLADADEDRLYISVVTVAELRYGIERLDDGERRRRLDEWLLHDLSIRFDGRILPVDEAVADEWGRIVAQRDARGRPIGAMDALTAATARVHGLTLVTRNETDFAISLDDIVNPWDEA